MDDFTRQALEIVKAQASVRPMTEEEMGNMLKNVTNMLKGVENETTAEESDVQVPFCDPKKAIKEKSVTCLECGKTFKILTKKHLETHGLTPEAYREKWGYKKGTSLIAKGLSKARRAKMQDMKLWTKKTPKADKTEKVIEKA